LSYKYTGYIDDFKVYNRALTTTDVSAIFYYGIMNINTLGRIDYLSTTAKSNIIYSGTTLQAGAYGIVLLLSSAISNPVIQIKAGTGGTPTDFYAATDGTAKITTSANGGRIGIVEFLNGQTGYVTKWYDQTGNGHHATAQGTTLPTFDTTNFVVNFGSVGYFTLPANSFPTGDLPYTYVYKHGTITRNTCTFCGGTDNGQGKFCMIYIADNTYNQISDAWSGYDVNTVSAVSNNSVICTNYGGGGNTGGTSNGRFIYVNNIKQTLTYYGLSTQHRAQTSTPCYLGYRAVTPAVYYKTTMPYFYWMPYQLSTSDIAILGST
jgi:hypothetical protein